MSPREPSAQPYSPSGSSSCCAGEWREEMTAKVPLANAPEGLVVGSVVELQNGMTATVTAVTEEHIEIDANQVRRGRPKSPK